MDSSPTSRLRHLDEAGAVVPAPLEWTRGLIEIDCDSEVWETARLMRNGDEMPLFVKRIGGHARVLADWPLSGCGTYELVLDLNDDKPTTSLVTTVAPRKMTSSAVEDMVEDLQRRLPATIAIALQRGGALAGLDLVPPNESTVAEEIHRLERAIDGTPGRPGLIRILAVLREQPYQVLRAQEGWTDRRRARRIDTSRLVQAFARPANLDERLEPIQIPERHVQHSVDVYENRLVRSFYDQVNTRLRMLLRALKRAQSNAALANDADNLLRRLTSARRAAAFMDDVSALFEPPSRVTMVLLRRSEYRSALEAFLEFRRRALVQLDEPALDAPLEELPSLYETWGTLEVISVVIETAVDLGYEVRRERLTRRDGGDLWIKVLPNGIPAAVLTHPHTGRVVRVVPQRSYPPNAEGLRSVSFTQIPDVAVEIKDPDGPTSIYIFDPKYKLRSEFVDGEMNLGKPKKVDIDTMHAYRDAIRNSQTERAVRYAAILYPGPTTSYGDGLAALQSNPHAPALLESAIRDVLLPAMSPSPAAVGYPS